MPGTVNDFMQRFNDSTAIDDQEASHYYDRFASNDQKDQEFDTHALSQGATEYLGKLPDDQFHQAAREAYAQAPPAQKQGLVSSLLSGLQSRGLGLGALSGMLGLKGLDPQQMDPDSYAKLANYTRREHPEVIQQTIKEQPWFMKALGNPFVMGALGVVAARMIKNRR